jgi:AcrR family transcriptional regulator
MSESLDTSHPSSAAHVASNPRATRILEAASQCFSEKGFQGTTIIDIADAAGVSRPLVYKYFGDKDGLIDSALQSTFADWQTLNEQFLATREIPAPPPFPPQSPRPAAGEGIAADTLLEKFRKTIEFVRQRPIFRAVLQHDPQIVMRGHLEELRECRAVSAASTRAILLTGATRGEFRADLELDATTASIEMILFGLLERALGIRPELTLESSLERSTIDLLLRGLLSQRSAS